MEDTQHMMETAVLKEKVNTMEENMIEVKGNVNTILVNHLPHMASDIQDVKTTVVKLAASMKPIIKIVYAGSGIILTAVLAAMVAQVLK